MDTAAKILVLVLGVGLVMTFGWGAAQVLGSDDLSGARGKTTLEIVLLCLQLATIGWLAVLTWIIAVMRQDLNRAVGRPKAGAEENLDQG